MTVMLKRRDGGWNHANDDRKMDLFEAFDWLKRHGYSVEKAWTTKSGLRVVNYTKPNTRTNYDIEYRG